ncbi:hypothetical protein G6F35_017353 [Rhizopus arrhizus]|nr:hypothetical protein G6F35_017353 [Rhizopus arrhizus]
MSVRKPRSTRAGRVTMQDVARRVGVSAITVSRALRTPDKVAEALRRAGPPRLSHADRRDGILARRRGGAAAEVPAAFAGRADPDRHRPQSRRVGPAARAADPDGAHDRNPAEIGRASWWGRV